MNRRRFVQGIVAAAAAPLAARLYAAPGESRFLLVFLRGGYDAASVLVPLSSAYYYESRPNIAIPREAALPLDTEWGLHPALRESAHTLYEKREAAFVPFAGAEDLSRSHFETQDSIELGQPLGGPRNYQSGFMNRLAAALGATRAIAFTNQLPVAFRGEAQVANVALRLVGKSGVDARQSALIGEMYAGSALGTKVTAGFAVRDEVMRELGTEMEAAGRNAINARGFEQQARHIARLMKSQFNLGFVDVGGWDTHVGQGGASGYLAMRLEELGHGIAAFAEELGPAWRDTVVCVLSEFGRTFRENGNRGTDHGHGTVYWFLGGAVRGGAVRGEQVKLERATLFQDRDYPVLNEYRALLGGVFTRLYGLEAARVERIFPGTTARDLALI
jgi:uncharacterized protein (DUF1501 family)